MRFETRAAAVRRACELLLEARRARMPLADFAAEAAPGSVAESYMIQDGLVVALGGHGGWKVGASSVEAEPLCAPLPRSGIFPSGAALAARAFSFIGIEVEIAFSFGRDLPGRAGSYERAEVLQAVASVCAAIEVVDSRLANWRTRPALEQCADLCSHGALIVGAPSRAAATIDQPLQRAELWVDDRKAVDSIGGNTAGDVQRLLCWLVNHAASRGRPVRAGDVVTTGSCSGLYEARAGQHLLGVLPGVGEVELTLA